MNVESKTNNLLTVYALTCPIIWLDLTMGKGELQIHLPSASCSSQGSPPQKFSSSKIAQGYIMNDKNSHEDE